MTAECTNLDHSNYRVAGNWYGLEMVHHEREHVCKKCGRPDFAQWFHDLNWNQKDPEYWRRVFKDAAEQAVFYWPAEPRGQLGARCVFVDADINDPTSILIPTRPDWAQGDLTVVIKQERYRRRMKLPKENNYGALQVRLEQELDRLIAENDLEYVDNHRYADVSNRKDVRRFHQQAEKGCCGSFEAEVTIGRRRFLVGCNYGH